MFGHVSAGNFYCISLFFELISENDNTQLFFKCFFLLMLRTYAADPPRGDGRLALRKNLTLSQILWQWAAFAQSRDTADARPCCRPVLLLLTNPR